MQSHIVDQLIAERAPMLHADPVRLRRARRILDPILKYDEARQVADAIKYKSGAQVMEYCQKRLKLRVEGEGLENLRPKGDPCIIIANHPTGIADGVAVWKWLTPARDDLMVYGNRDSHRVCTGAYEFIVPVEQIEERQTREKTRETLDMTRKCFDAGRSLIIFPSGRMSYINWLPTPTFRERDWKTSAIKLAMRYKLPVIPMTIRSFNSPLFYFFSLLSEELRDICLFYELINKQNQLFKMKMGTELDLSKYAPDQAEELTPLLQQYVERGDYHRPFEPLI